MLTPNQIENLPKSMVELYAQVEDEIIANMAKRISAYKDFIPAAEWQYIKLTEMGAVHEDIIKKLSKVSGMSSKEIEELMRDAGVKAIKTDMSVYKKAGLDTTRATEGLQRVLNAGIKNTNGLFSNLARTTASTASRQFEHALDLSWMQINTGAFSPTEAIQNAIRTLTDRGIATMEYPSGHKDYLDVAVRRAVLTGVNQASLKMQETLADEMATDLVEVTAHAGARTGKGVANHAEWQGKIYSRSGAHPKYPSLREVTGYGTVQGLGGVNCRHSFFPFIDGISEPVYTQAELDKLNAPMYTFKGNKLTEYEATQYQRKIERNIRRFRREKYAMEAAGLSSNSAKANLAEWRREQKIFHEQTGLKRQHDREQVYGFKKQKKQKEYKSDNKNTH